MSKFGRILLAFALAALALTAFASSAMAEGQIRDVTTNETIPAKRVLHLVGWAQFTSGNEGVKCDVTATLEPTVVGGTEGTVTAFNIPDTTKCQYIGAKFNTCLLSAHGPGGLPWKVKTTKTPDFDITGNIVFNNTFKAGSCPFVFPVGRITRVKLTFAEITARPLKTGNEVNTGTSNTLGATAALNDPIAGVEISGKGNAEVEFDSTAVVNQATEASGKLELTSPDRCTWKVV